jgi:hypothetical protein
MVEHRNLDVGPHDARPDHYTPIDERDGQDLSHVTSHDPEANSGGCVGGVFEGAPQAAAAPTMEPLGDWTGLLQSDNGLGQTASLTEDRDWTGWSSDAVEHSDPASADHHVAASTNVDWTPDVDFDDSGPFDTSFDDGGGSAGDFDGSDPGDGDA